MIPLRKIKSILFVSVLIAGLFTSCKKDNDIIVDPNPDKGYCSLTEMNFGSGTAGMKTTLTYNAAKQLIESHTLSFGMVYGTKYSYTAQNLLVETVEYQGANKEATWKTTYSYSNDQLKENKVYAFYDGAWTLVEIRKYEYQNGRRSKVRYFGLVDGAEVETAYRNYTYDGNNNVISILGFELNGASEWTEVTRRTFSYEPKSASWTLLTILTEDPAFPATQLIKSDKSEEWDENDQKWLVTEDLSYSYTYNDKGLPVTLTEDGTGTAQFTYHCN